MHRNVRLHLKKSTLRQLTSSHLATVRGGTGNSDDLCVDTYGCDNSTSCPPSTVSDPGNPHELSAVHC